MAGIYIEPQGVIYSQQTVIVEQQPVMYAQPVGYVQPQPVLYAQPQAVVYAQQQVYAQPAATVVMVDRPVPHLLHFLLCFITGGFWLPFWIGDCLGCCTCLR